MKRTGLTVIAIAAFLAGCAATPAPQEQGKASTKLEWSKGYSVEVLETVEDFGFFHGYELLPLTGSAAMGADPGLVSYVNDRVSSGLGEQGLLTGKGQKIDVSGQILSAGFESDRALIKAKIQLADAHNGLPLSAVMVESTGQDRKAAGEALSIAIVEYLSGLIGKE